MPFIYINITPYIFPITPLTLHYTPAAYRG